jgi:dTDP-4-amino-4,6-dideoxygalactose transaminase
MSSRSAETQTEMRVPLIDLSAQHRSLREQLLVAIERVVDSQQFVLGPEVQALEEGIARYCHTRHAIGCASGSDALLLALMALDLKAGDEVITSPFTFFATAAAIARLGARVVFVDIDPRTYNLDVKRVESAINPRTRAILPVHMYGQCAEMKPLQEISERREIPIVEDAAQALGAEYDGSRAGSMGLLGCFSFYPTKNLGGAGDGGMITTDDDKLADRLRTLRVHGGRTEYEHSEIGINSRLDSIQAAVLGVKLKYVDDWSEARRERAERYTQLLHEASLTENVIPPFVNTDSRHIFHQYVVRVPQRRDELRDRLSARGISTKIYYPVPLHLQKCFQYLGYREGDFPAAESAALETFALPLFPELSKAQQVYVVQTLQKFFEPASRQ